VPETVSRRGLLGALILAAVSYAMSQTLLIPSLPEIQRQLGTSVVGVSTLVSAFAVAGAVASGIVGRLADLVGKRRMLILQLAVFCAGALACALVRSLPLLIAGRVLMGTTLSIFPLSYSIVRDEIPAESATGVLAVVSATVGIGSAIGQGVGGLLTGHFGYEAIFLLSAGMGLASMSAAIRWVPPSRVRTAERLDIPGACLLGLGLGALLVAVSEAPSWGWTGAPTLALAAAGLVILGLLVAYERDHPHPLVHLPSLAIRQVALTNLATVLLGFGAIGGSAVILSQFFQVPAATGWGPGASATQAGLYLIPGALVLVAVSPLAGIVSSRIGLKTTMTFGSACAGAGLGLMAISHHHTFELYLWPSVMYIGLSFALGAMPTLILREVPSTRSGQATAANIIFRSIGTSLGVQVPAAIVASTAHHGIPTEGGFVAALALLTAGCLAAALVSGLLREPERRNRRTRLGSAVA
jgi:MFS family permease